jgi:hypothetical protein
MALTVPYPTGATRFSMSVMVAFWVIPNPDPNSAMAARTATGRSTRTRARMPAAVVTSRHPAGQLGDHRQPGQGGQGPGHEHTRVPDLLHQPDPERQGRHPGHPDHDPEQSQPLAAALTGDQRRHQRPGDQPGPDPAGPDRFGVQRDHRQQQVEPGHRPKGGHEDQDQGAVQDRRPRGVDRHTATPG